MIPDGIKREHILKAIEEIKGSEIPAQRDSDKYELEYDSRLYPPKYVVPKFRLKFSVLEANLFTKPKKLC